MKTKTLKAIRSIIQERESGLMPILQCFYITSEYLWFTNLQMFIRIKHKFPVKEGSKPIVIRADHFISRIESIKAPYFINCDEEVAFEMAESKTTLRSNDSNDFPLSKLNQCEYPKLFDLTAYEVSIMNIASMFTADDDLSEVLGTVCVSGEFIVASDAHVLYFRKITELCKQDVMFNKKIIKLMMLFPAQNFRIGENKGWFNAEGRDVSIWWRGSDTSNYPKWQSVIPEVKYRVIIPVKETISALDAIRFAVNQSSHSVRFRMTGNKLELSGKNTEEGILASESVNIINTDNNTTEYCMKLDFIKLLLKTLMEEGYAQVEMGYVVENKAFVFANQILLMPMLLSNSWS